MDRDETIALFERCEKARSEALAAGKSKDEAHEVAKTMWNGWATEVLHKKQNLLQSNAFEMGKASYDADPWIAPESTGLNELTQAWIHEAKTDFHGHTFHKRPDFSEYIFPGPSIFGESKQLTAERNRRPSVVFEHGAAFDRAIFLMDAVFDWAESRRSMGFGHVMFHDIVRFDQCNFNGTAWFQHATFKHDAWFGQTKFFGYTYFHSAEFFKHCSFYAVKSEGAFILDRAKFHYVPDFTQVSFQGSPHIDNAHISRRSVFGPIFYDDGRIDQEAPAKFRELKRYAIQGEDHLSELLFHAQEIRTARFVTDWPWHPRFWFGVAYGIFSDFGRSIVRPTIAMALLAAIFATYFLSVSAGLNGREPDYWALATFQPQPCTHSATATANLRTAQTEIAARTNATTEAWSLALKNAFVFINWDRADAARRNYGCLYGLTTDGRLTYPYVPSRVSFASLIQIILSSVLLFLLLLGIRNLLKLK